MNKILLGLMLLISTACFSQTVSTQRDSVAQTPAFQTKVKMATHKAANNILADTTQPLRVRQYAQLVITEPNGGWLPAISYGCMTNVAINYNSTDSDIEFTVNSLFAKYAYAYYREPQR